MYVVRCFVRSSVRPFVRQLFIYVVFLEFVIYTVRELVRYVFISVVIYLCIS